MSILPHCSDGQLDCVLTEAVTQGLWDSVDKLLSRDRSHRQRQWALDQAIQHAHDSQMKRLLENHGSICGTDQLSSLFTQAVTRGLWGCIVQMQRKTVIKLTPEQRNWTLSEACKRATGYELLNIVHVFCDSDNVGSVLPDLIRRRQWWSLYHGLCSFTLTETQQSWIVTEASKYADETDLESLLRYCPRNLLDTVVKEAVQRGFWRTLNYLLYSKVSPEVCKLAVEEATKHANDNEFKSIIKHKVSDQLDLVLTSAVTRRLWDVVGSLLDCRETYLHPEKKKEIPQGLQIDRVQWALEEASKYANKHQMLMILRQCPCDSIRLDPILTETIKRGLWEAVAEILKHGVSDAKRKWVVEEAAKYTGHVHVNDMEAIFQQCVDDQLDMVLTEVVKQKLWTCAVTLLTRDASEPHRRRVLEEASKNADDDELSQIIHYCANDQLYSMLMTVVGRELWECVKYLLKRDASEPYRRWVLEEVSKEANDDELSEMLNFCVDDQVDSMLTTVVGRHLWECVDYLLNRKVSGTRKTWAMEQACENAPEQTLLDILGRHSVEECYDSALVATLRRCLLRAVCLLLSQLADEQQIRSAVKKAADTLTQDERDKVVETAFNLDAWAVFFLVLEQSHVSEDLIEQIIDNIECPIDLIEFDVDGVLSAVIQHCNSSQLIRVLSEAVQLRQISTARDVLTRIGQHGDPLVVTDDGRTVLQVVTETKLSMNCRRQLVAECIKLGVSTHQPPITDSVQRPPHTSSPSRTNTDFWSSGTSVSSPLGCAVLQPDLKLMAMLWESGSCSPKELHTVIDSFTMSTISADPDTPDTAQQDIVSYLKTAASTPRSLQSACRLVISHYLGVGCRRHESVKQLPLPDKLCNYVLFSDLVDPETSASAQQGDGSGTVDQAGVSSTGDVSPETCTDSIYTLLQETVEHLSSLPDKGGSSSEEDDDDDDYFPYFCYL